MTRGDYIRRPTHQLWHDYTPGCSNQCVKLDDHPTLPYVYMFAAVMEQKFHENRDKGNREGWMALPPDVIYGRMQAEMRELGEALDSWLLEPTVENARALCREAADVANYGLELSSRVDGLP